MNDGLVLALFNSATALFAVVGLLVALRQLRASREMNAQTAYEEYHHLVLQHSEIGVGLFNYDTASDIEKHKYRWFILSMLLTVERILTLFPRDKNWRSALEQDIVIHAPFLMSPAFAVHRESLDSRVCKLIDSVLARAKLGDRSELNRRRAALGLPALSSD